MNAGDLDAVAELLGSEWDAAAGGGAGLPAAGGRLSLPAPRFEANCRAWLTRLRQLHAAALRPALGVAVFGFAGAASP